MGGRDRAWTDDEIALLKAEYPNGHSRHELECFFPGRCYETIRKRASILGFARKPGWNGSKEPWTDEEEQVLRQMTAHGASRGQISLVLGRSISAISDKRTHLKLARKSNPNIDNSRVTDASEDAEFIKACRAANVAFGFAMLKAGYNPGLAPVEPHAPTARSHTPVSWVPAQSPLADA